jgi:two-component system response regulator FlrC
VLKTYHWPGNVRELENVIQRALIMAAGNSIGPEVLNLAPRPSAEASPVLPAAEAMAPSGLTETEKRVDNMKDLERDHILRTLAEVDGSRKKAIERLGISERTLRYKLQQYRDEGYFQD